MIPSNLYGRPISHWLCYKKLPMLLGTKLYVVDLSQVYSHEVVRLHGGAYGSN